MSVLYLSNLIDRIWNELIFGFNILKSNKNQQVVANIILISILLFFSLTMFFELSRIVFLNYYLKEGIGIGVFGIGLIIIGAVISGIIVVYLFEKFRLKQSAAFYVVYSILFILFYYLMLANSVFSYFSYIEMNDLLYVIINSITLYLTLTLSSFLLSNIKEFFSSLSTGGGIIAALFSLGCPSCGAFLWSLAGIAGFANFLPFGGLELRITSLLFLIWALWEMYKSLNFKKKFEVKFQLN